MKRALWTAVALALVAGVAPTALAQQNLTVEEWARKHDIEFHSEPGDLYPLKTHYGPITGKAAPEKDVQRYKNLLLPELKKYPSGYVKKLKIKKIILAQDLKFDGQKRAAIPDFEHQYLHLDPKEGDYNKTYQQTVIHHEIFHIVDLLDDRELYDDAAWKKLNPADFKYGSGGKNARGSDQWPLDDTLEGFLNKYSQSGVEEDKAEIYSNLIVRPKLVYARAEKDPILSKKVARMKELLKSFSPDIDETFWKSLGS
jgi:hypothetical protein